MFTYNSLQAVCCVSLVPPSFLSHLNNLILEGVVVPSRKLEVVEFKRKLQAGLVLLSGTMDQIQSRSRRELLRSSCTLDTC